MEIEVLVVPDCPHRAAAVGLVRELLDELRLSTTQIRIGVIDTAAEAVRRGFAGSPTILVDGVDPFAELGQPAALACRIYRGEAGAGPLPDKQALRRILRAARAAD